MGIAGTLRQFLRDVRVHYQLLPKAEPSKRKAVAHPILYQDRRGHLVLAVVPAGRQVDVGRLSTELHCVLEPASERTVRQVFRDCERGAIPPVGQAYGVEVVCDDSLLESRNVYFEAGDLARLVRVSGADFRRLMSSMEHAHLSQP